MKATVTRARSCAARRSMPAVLRSASPSGSTCIVPTPEAGEVSSGDAGPGETRAAARLLATSYHPRGDQDMAIQNRRAHAHAYQGDDQDGPQDLSADQLFRARPSCCSRCPVRSRRPAMPSIASSGFVERGRDQGQGVDTIACMAVNDVFVMNAWGKSGNATDKVLMLADGNGDYSEGAGPRTRRAQLRRGACVASQRSSSRTASRLRQRRGQGQFKGLGRRLRARPALSLRPTSPTTHSRGPRGPRSSQTPIAPKSREVRTATQQNQRITFARSPKGLHRCRGTSAAMSSRSRRRPQASSCRAHVYLSLDPYYRNVMKNNRSTPTGSHRAT